MKVEAGHQRGNCPQKTQLEFTIALSCVENPVPCTLGTDDKKNFASSDHLSTESNINYVNSHKKERILKGPNLEIFGSRVFCKSDLYGLET
jgi:hypothetical protein